MRLLAEAGLLEAVDATAGAGLDWRPKRLTWKGHEFLDDARNENVWRKTQELVQEKGGSVSLGVLQALLTEVAKSLFGLM